MKDLIQLKRKDNVVIEAEFKILDESYIDKIMELENDVYNGLDNKELYSVSSREDFLEFISTNKGEVLGCVSIKDDKLIAMGVYGKFGYDKSNYGYDIELEGEELLKVGQIESTVVKNNFRGNKLQKIICEHLERIGKENNTPIICATASPYNKYSLNTFKTLGYEVKKDKLKYGGLRRYVLVKEL